MGGDELVIDNPLFKLHHQASTFVIMFGLLFIFLENHLDGRAIICQGGDQYASSYCWIHGTAYVREHLQGKATGCFVDQSKIESEEDAPVTAYYLWIPFLLTFCFGFAKFPRSVWRNFLENGLIRNILGGQSDPAVICQNFLDFRMRYAKYHIYFGFCEFLNLLMVLLSMFMTDALLLNKFFAYGQEVINYLCILNNNIFNQKYFLVLWLWWFFLIAISVIGLVYRFARIMIPDLSRSVLMRKVRAWRLENLELSGADCFVLDLLGDNIPHPVMDQVLGEIAKRTVMKNDLDHVDNHNQNLLKSTTAL